MRPSSWASAGPTSTRPSRRRASSCTTSSARSPSSTSSATTTATRTPTPSSRPSSAAPARRVREPSARPAAAPTAAPNRPFRCRLRASPMRPCISAASRARSRRRRPSRRTDRSHPLTRLNGAEHTLRSSSHTPHARPQACTRARCTADQLGPASVCLRLPTGAIATGALVDCLFDAIDKGGRSPWTR